MSLTAPNAQPLNARLALPGSPSPQPTITKPTSAQLTTPNTSAPSMATPANEQPNGVNIIINNPQTRVDSPSINNDEAGPVVTNAPGASEAFPFAVLDSSALGSSLAQQPSSSASLPNAEVVSLPTGAEPGSPKAHLQQVYQGVEAAFDQADASRQAFMDDLNTYYRKAEAYTQLANQLNNQAYTQWAQQSAAIAPQAGLASMPPSAQLALPMAANPAVVLPAAASASAAMAAPASAMPPVGLGYPPAGYMPNPSSFTPGA